MTSLVVLVWLVVLVAPAVEGQTVPGGQLSEVLDGLRKGNAEQVTATFRFFAKTVGAEEASKDRRIVKSFVGLVVSHLGRAEIGDPLTSTEKAFANVYMESATPDLWRNSDCVFKEYVFPARFLRENQQLQGEVWLETCADQNTRTLWLRKIDIHVVRPDRNAIRIMQELFQALQLEIRRVRGPQS